MFLIGGGECPPALPVADPMLQWSHQNFGRGGHSTKMYSSKKFEKFWNFLKKLHKIIKNFSKIFNNNKLKHLKPFNKIFKSFKKILKSLLNFQKILKSLK